MQIHNTPIVSHLRIFSEGKSYDNYDQYDSIITVVYTIRDKVVLEGMRGEMDRRTYRAVYNWLKDNGVKEASFERHGKVVIVPIT